MQAAIEHGVAGLSWREPVPGAHVARAALSYLHHQVEPGTSCPLTMTHAAVPALRRAPALAEWAEKAAAPHYDPRDVPIADKRGVTLGMGMTEKQGGSDVRANTTRAQALEGDDYALTGHKWFFSAPMSDGFLVLAQAPGGLTCFLLPRRLRGRFEERLHAHAFEGQARRLVQRIVRSRIPGRARARASARKGAASPRSSTW